MAEFISMKRTTEEKKNNSPNEVASIDEQEDFPWGLRINLNKEEIKKLNISMPEVGTEATIMAKVKVVSVRESADANDTDRNIEYQITDIAFPTQDEDPERANRMFPNSGGS